MGELVATASRLKETVAHALLPFNLLPRIHPNLKNFDLRTFVRENRVKCVTIRRHYMNDRHLPVIRRQHAPHDNARPRGRIGRPGTYSGRIASQPM